EVALLKAIEARQAVSIDALLTRLQGLRDTPGSDVSPLPSPTPKPRPDLKPSRAQAQSISLASPSSPASASIESRPQSELTVLGRVPSRSLRELWAQLIEAVGRASPFTRTYLLEAHPVAFEKNLFTIGFAPEFEDHLGLVDNARNHTLLQTKLVELGHP